MKTQITVNKFEAGSFYKIENQGNYKIVFRVIDRKVDQAKLEIVDMQINNFKYVLNVALNKFYNHGEWFDIVRVADVNEVDEFINIASMFNITAYNEVK